VLQALDIVQNNYESENAMDAKNKQRWGQIAIESLEATADDEEQWSFLFRTPGSIELLYCPWAAADNLDFDGELEGLTLPWSRERLDLIGRGDAEPNDDELAQWRKAMCQHLAAGSDWCRPAWIIPLRSDGTIAAWALFLSGPEDEGEPYLEGIFDNYEEAKATLANEGAIAA
jgi:hypothetical protein